MSTTTTSLVSMYILAFKKYRVYRQSLVRLRALRLSQVLFFGLLSVSFIEPLCASSVEQEVGVAAASTTQSIGFPPLTPEHLLHPGVRIVLDEQVKTDTSGRLQILFLDGTTLTLGSSSDLVIDKYFYDPNSGDGSLVASATKGLFRVIGGKISKKNDISFNTPTAKISIRGGMGDIRVGSESVSAYFYYGSSMSVTSNGVKREMFRPGFTISTTSGAVPNDPEKSKLTELEALSKQLEVVSVEGEADDVGAETAGSAEPTTDSPESEDISPDRQKDKKAKKNAQPSAKRLAELKAKIKAERAKRLAQQKVSSSDLLTPVSAAEIEPKSTPVDVTESATTSSLEESVADVTESASDTSSAKKDAAKAVSNARAAAWVASRAAQSARLSKEAAQKRAALYSKYAASAQKRADTYSRYAEAAQKRAADYTRKAAAAQAAADKACYAKDRSCRIKTLLAARYAAISTTASAAASSATARYDAASAAASSATARYDATSAAASSATARYHAAVEVLRAAIANLKVAQSTLAAFGRTYARAPTTGFVGGISFVGAVESVDTIEIKARIEKLGLCRACRFLQWGYFSDQVSVGSGSSFMAFWVDGVSSTAAQISSAASKQAHYSGDLIGAVWDRGQKQIQHGNFNSQISFSASTYDVDAFSATFDGNSFWGVTAAVSNSDEFEIQDTANGRVFNASGYFFGNPRVYAAPPPELAGQFSITGKKYLAGGVFAGTGEVSPRGDR